MSKRSVFRGVHLFLKPIEIVLTLIVGVVVLYFVALRLNAPQALLNRLVASYTPPGQSCTIGPISGLFPLSFCVDFIRTEALDLNGIRLVWNGVQMDCVVTIDEILIKERKPVEQSNTLTSQESDSVENMVNTLPSLLAKLKTLPIVRRIQVQSIHNATNTYKGNLEFNLKAKEGPYVLISGQTRQGEVSANLRLLPSGSAPGLAYEVGLTQTKKHLKTSGTLTLNDDHWLLTGNIANSSWRELKDGRYRVCFSLHEVLHAFKQKPSKKSTENVILRGYAALPQLAAVPLVHWTVTDRHRLSVAVLEGRLERLMELSLGVEPKLKDETLKAFARVHWGKSVRFSGFVRPNTEGTFSAEGQYREGLLTISSLKGKWRGRSVECSPIEVNLQTKQMQPMTVVYDGLTLTTTAISLQDSAASNQWKLSPIGLYSKPKNLDCGVLTLSGRWVPALSPGQAGPVHSGPDQTESSQLGQSQAGSPSAKAASLPSSWQFVAEVKLQPTHFRDRRHLNLAAEGSLILTPQTVHIANAKLRTGSTRNVLTLDAEANVEHAEAHAGRVLTLADFGRALRVCASGTTTKREAALCRGIRLKGTCRGTLDLSVLCILLSHGDRILGNVTSDLLMSGNLADPKLNGHFDLADGYYENVNNGIVLKDITLNAVGKDAGLVFQSVHLVDGTSLSKKVDKAGPMARPVGGFANGGGGLTFFTEDPAHRWSPRLLLILHCHALQVVYSDLLKARATGELRLDGPLNGLSDQPVVTGNVCIDAMAISLKGGNGAVAPAAKENWKIQDGSHLDVTQTQQRSPLQLPQRFGMNILLRTGDYVVIEGNGLSCYLQGTLTAKGPMTEAYLVGQLTTNPSQKNVYNLFGQVMTFKDGLIRYDEADLNNPIVQIALTTQLSGKEITAQLDGRLADTKITLSSVPAMTNEEIVSLLLFRQGFDELSMQQNLHVKAFSSQMLKGSPIDKLRDKVKLDSFEFVETQDEVSGETTQSVRIGKSLKKAKIFIEQNIAPKNESKVTVRYDITTRSGVEGSISTDPTSSRFGWNWRKRF